MATDKQRSQFFKLWARAKPDVCAAFGADGAAGEREARHGWIRECTDGRTEDINAVRPGAEYSRLMLRTAEAAGDYREAAYWVMDAAKRWRWLSGQMLRQLGEITQTETPWEYAQGVLAHMRLPRTWEDVPERDLEALFQALDTHRRRILKRDHGWEGLRKSDTDPLSFYPEASYFRRADGRLGIRFPAVVRAARPARSEPRIMREAVTA